MFAAAIGFGGDGGAAGQRQGGAEQFAAAGQRNDLAVAAGHLPHRVGVAEIGGIVDEAAQIDLMLGGKMREQRMAADLVALVGRIGQAVGEEQHLHGCTG